ncbi:response regulator transcription factor [Sinomonas sp. ASV322]|uniref:response regulator transcription factor n=1 Tax=Sinomonas sp. ASV322 TaxID=3041920 RepID=UPI0035A37DEB
MCGGRGARTERALVPLSQRESEIPRHVAEASTNPEIAELPYGSERTVEHHVRGILHKLVLPNRAAKAAWVVRSPRYELRARRAGNARSSRIACFPRCAGRGNAMLSSSGAASERRHPNGAGKRRECVILKRV